MHVCVSVCDDICPTLRHPSQTGFHSTHPQGQQFLQRPLKPTGAIGPHSLLTTGLFSGRRGRRRGRRGLPSGCCAALHLRPWGGHQERGPRGLALPSSPRKARLPSSHQPQFPRAQNGTLVPVSSLTSCNLRMPLLPAQRQGLKGCLKGKQTWPLGCPAQRWHRREPGHMAGDMKLTKGTCKVFILSLTNLSLIKMQREGVHSTPTPP